MIYVLCLQTALLGAILALLLYRHQVPPAVEAQPLRGPAIEPHRDQVHLLMNGRHHSYRAEGHHDVLAIRRGEYPGFSIEGE